MPLLSAHMSIAGEYYKAAAALGMDCVQIFTKNNNQWRAKSLDALVIELERADALGLEGLVIHPGSCVSSCEEQGLQRIVKALDLALDRTQGRSTEIWLETTAGQGTNLGYRFEHLQYLLDESAENRYRTGL